MPDDSRVLLAARQEARKNFDDNRRVGIDTGMKINHAVEVANILRHNLVQGARENGDDAAKWGMPISLDDHGHGHLLMVNRTPNPRRHRAWRQ